jgi:hypothetical protein
MLTNDEYALEQASGQPGENSASVSNGDNCSRECRITGNLVRPVALLIATLAGLRWYL